MNNATDVSIFKKLFFFNKLMALPHLQEKHWGSHLSPHALLCDHWAGHWSHECAGPCLCNLTYHWLRRQDVAWRGAFWKSFCFL